MENSVIEIKDYHSFNVLLACEVGIEKAVLLQNIEFWVKKNKANNKHLYEGVYWTYNTAEAFAKLYPYLSQQSIARQLRELESSDYLLSTTKLNEHGYQRTKWYSLGEKYVSFFKIHFSNLKNGDLKNENSIFEKSKMFITDINTDINTDIDSFAVSNETCLNSLLTANNGFLAKENNIQGLSMQPTTQKFVDTTLQETPKETSKVSHTNNATKKTPTKKAKEAHPAYTQFVETFFTTFEELFDAPCTSFTSREGKCVNEIIKKLTTRMEYKSKGETPTNEKLVSAFKLLLTSHNHTFFAKDFRLSTLNTNFDAIANSVSVNNPMKFEGIHLQLAQNFDTPQTVGNYNSLNFHFKKLQETFSIETIETLYEKIIVELQAYKLKINENPNFKVGSVFAFLEKLQEKSYVNKLNNVVKQSKPSNFNYD